MALVMGVQFRSRYTLDLAWDMSGIDSGMVLKMVRKWVENVFQDQIMIILLTINGETLRSPLKLSVLLTINDDFVS